MNVSILGVSYLSLTTKVICNQLKFNTIITYYMIYFSRRLFQRFR